MCQQARTSGKDHFIQATTVLSEFEALLTALVTLGPSWPTQRTRTFAALHRHPQLALGSHEYRAVLIHPQAGTPDQKAPTGNSGWRHSSCHVQDMVKAAHNYS